MNHRLSLLGVLLGGLLTANLCFVASAATDAQLKSSFVNGCMNTCYSPKTQAYKGMKTYCSSVCSCSWDNLVKKKPASQLVKGISQEAIQSATTPCVNKALPALKKANGK